MAPDARADDAQLDLLLGQLLELVGDGLDRALHVGLQDEGQLLELALGDGAAEVLEADAGGGGHRLLAQLQLAEVHDRLRLELSVTAEQLVARLGQRRQAEDLDRRRRAGLLEPRPAVVDEGADLAATAPATTVSPTRERAVLDEDGRHRAAALVEPRLEHRADRGLPGVGLELLQVGHEQEHLEQLVEVLLLLRRDVDEDGGAAPLLGHEPAVGELLVHAVGLGVRLVDLVDRHDDRHAGRLRVVHGLDRLRHDAVVRGHDEDDDVGDLGAAGAHEGEGLVAGGVEEDDLPRADVDVVGADVLGDAAGLARRHLGLADRVEERGLAVVDVAHDRDHGRARDEVLRLRLHRLDLDDLLLEGLDRGLVAELLADLDGQLRVEALVDRRHDAARDERLHDVAALDVGHLLRQLLDGDALGEGDLARRPGVDRLLFPRRRRQAGAFGLARGAGVRRAAAGGPGPAGRGGPASRRARPGRHRVRGARQHARRRVSASSACGLVGCGPTGRGGAIGRSGRGGAGRGHHPGRTGAGGRRGRVGARRPERRTAAATATGAGRGDGGGAGGSGGRDRPAPGRRAGARSRWCAPGRGTPRRDAGCGRSEDRRDRPADGRLRPAAAPRPRTHARLGAASSAPRPLFLDRQRRRRRDLRRQARRARRVHQRRRRPSSPTRLARRLGASCGPGPALRASRPPAASAAACSRASRSAATFSCCSRSCRSALGLVLLAAVDAPLLAR